MNMFNNYPPGMSYNDLVHVGEYPEPDPEYGVCSLCGDEINLDNPDEYDYEDGELVCDYCMRKIMAGE